MKIRMNHVTNSSSSSFIIAYRRMPEIDEETLKKYPFLKKYGYFIEKVLMTSGEYSDTTEGEIYSTPEEIEDYILDCYGCSDDTLETLLKEDEYAKEEYDFMMNFINKKYNILSKRIDYCDDALVNLIRDIEDGENIIIAKSYD